MNPGQPPSLRTAELPTSSPFPYYVGQDGATACLTKQGDPGAKLGVPDVVMGRQGRSREARDTKNMGKDAHATDPTPGGCHQGEHPDTPAFAYDDLAKSQEVH
jgi:hypothetical protein